MSDLPPNLPLEICHEILLRSPAESLFRFRAVCKEWRQVIDDPSFARAHTFGHLSSSSSHTTLVLRNTLGPPFEPLHTFDLDAVDLFTDGDRKVSGSTLDLDSQELCLLRRLPVSACNGLILVHPCRTDDPSEIWNPSTHEVLQLPRVDYYHEGRVLFGLGYDHASQDFKAVAIDHPETHVYSLRSARWRTVGDWLSGDDLRAKDCSGVFVHGALHWLLYGGFEILALDLATEKYRHIKVNALPSLGNYPKEMDVLGGCLAVSGFSVSRFNVWVMKDYGSDDESWIKLFSIKRVDMIPFRIIIKLRPVAYMKDKKQVFLKDDGSGFFLFDLESDSMKRVRIKGLTGRSYAQIIPRSMFRLRDNCGTRRIFPLDRPQKRKLSLAICSCPVKKQKKNS